MEPKANSSGSGEWLRIGPWGDVPYGSFFDCKPNGHITLIVVRHDEFVHSISFQTVCEDRKYHYQFGGDGGNVNEKVTIDGPDEYITCLNVTFSYLKREEEKVISSFGFSTNMTTYGPFGKISESKLSIPVTGGPIVGFHGRYNWKFLIAIGVYAMPQSLTQKNVANLNGSGEWLRIGPWGGLQHGLPFDYKPNGHISLIVIHHDECVHSISFQSVCEGRKYYYQFGGAGGNINDKVTIDGPDEYITCLNVTFSDFESEKVISSFSFSTNLTTYGPFGKISKSKFSIPVSGGPIVGFQGYAGRFLNAIGVYAMPESLVQRNVVKKRRVETLSDVIVPWGGREGRPWDDGVYVAVNKVRVQIGSFGTDSTHLVTSVQFMYEKSDGSFVWSPVYGKNLNSVENVTIDCSKEALIGVEGFYGKLCLGDIYDRITSLTFHTTTQKYGPYGEEIGMFFSSDLSGGKVVGFLGRSGKYLNAIGVHMMMKQE